MGNDTIINHVVKIQGQRIIEGSCTQRPCRRPCTSLRIRRHCKENRDNGIKRKISNATILHIQRERGHADKVVLAKQEWFLGSIINWDWNIWISTLQYTAKENVCTGLVKVNAVGKLAIIPLGRCCRTWATKGLHILFGSGRLRHVWQICKHQTRRPKSYQKMCRKISAHAYHLRNTPRID